MTSREPTGQAISDGGWMDAAIEAARDALLVSEGYDRAWDEITEAKHYDGWADDYASFARVAVAAALPHIRSALADEILALQPPTDAPLGVQFEWNQKKPREVLAVAARVARGGPLDA